MDAGALQIDEGHTAERVYDSAEEVKLADKPKTSFTTTETKLADGNTVEVVVQPSKVNSLPKPNGVQAGEKKLILILTSL